MPTSKYLGILIGGFHDRRHHRPLQYAFFYGGRVSAVFLSEVKAVDASPYDFSLAARLCASAIGRLAFSAHQKLRQGVVA